MDCPSSSSSQAFTSVLTSHHRWQALLGSAFLVTVPVFLQAPLVRSWPLLSLWLTGGWLLGGLLLLRYPRWRSWGDLLVGFSWSWFAGSIYWGWFRWEPLLHLPVESIGVPFAIGCLFLGRGKVGSGFYLGSLLGTAVTDLYFYLTGLIPYWRQLMQADSTQVSPIFQSALAAMANPWAIGWAMGLMLLLLVIGCRPLRSPALAWWAFGGAVLSTILVDSLFGLLAWLA